VPDLYSDLDAKFGFDFDLTRTPPEGFISLEVE
jgi:hypothetical protein